MSGVALHFRNSPKLFGVQSEERLLYILLCDWRLERKVCKCAGVNYLKQNGVKTMWQSMLRFPAGALKLNNYPATLRNIVPEVLGPDGVTQQLAPTDMAAMEIYRDRERGVPRYNEFRKWCAQIPPKRCRNTHTYMCL